ncbi:hypothetical protein [Mesobacillus zeae]|uniref:Uncharacterized protein n=1 Tax=Mesobacillus zeae TaxID=1917180 RepID=A0A398BB09_9BACI|nr:hypothetical protein [Mesobacillus zeae]RID86744.1 hypothetical protein D1970_05665 [Mesobacillus zeae]
MNESSGESNENKSEQKELSKKEKQKIILQFVNEKTKKVSDYEEAAFKSLSSVSGENFTNDQTLHTELVNNTLPAYKKALEEAKGITPGLSELEKPTKQMVKATEIFYEALQLEKKALEKQDSGLIEQSNVKMTEYQKLIEEYHSQMQKIAKEYNVEYTPNRS